MNEQEQRATIAELGHVPSKWQELLIEHHPEVLTTYLEWAKAASVRTEISPKLRELIIIAVDCAVRYPSPFIDNHIRKAMDAGATLREVIEVIEVTSQLLGPQMLNHGLTAVAKVIDEGRTPAR